MKWNNEAKECQVKIFPLLFFSPWRSLWMLTVRQSPTRRRRPPLCWRLLRKRRQSWRLSQAISLKKPWKGGCLTYYRGCFFCPLLISRVELCGEEWGVELTKVENQNIPTVWQIIIGGVKNTFSPLHLDFLDTKLKLLTPAAPVCLRQIWWMMTPRARAIYLKHQL